MNYSNIDLTDRASINQFLHNSPSTEQLGLLNFALRLHSDDLFFHAHIGRIHYGLGNFAQATVHLDKVINASSVDASVYFHRALIHREDKNWDACEAMLKHATTLTDNADYSLCFIAVLMTLISAIEYPAYGLRH